MIHGVDLCPLPTVDPAPASEADLAKRCRESGASPAGLIEATLSDLGPSVTSDGKSAGLVPLKHTRVEAEISGFLSRVKVVQEFENNFNEKIEAIYVFPGSVNG